MVSFTKKIKATSMIIIKLHKNHIILGKHKYQALNSEWLIVTPVAKM